MEDTNFEKEGIVVEVLRNARFMVDFGTYQINCYLSGKMRLHHINVLMGDKVLVVVEKDLSNGRIIKRK